MAVIVQVTLRGVTREQYDAVRAECGWLDEQPAGGLGHLTWWDGDVCCNVDAWESAQAFAAFAEGRLEPAMAAAGVTTRPEITMADAHEVYLPAAQCIAPTATRRAPTDNTAILRSGYDAFARGDVPAVLALFDESITWSSPDTVPFGGVCIGTAEVAGFFAHLPEIYAEINVRPQTFVEQGDTVAVVGETSGRAAAGAAFALPFVHVWTMSNGRATAFTEFLDTMKLNTALGVPAQRIDLTQRTPAGTA